MLPTKRGVLPQRGCYPPCSPPWLACLLRRALAWSGLGLSCLPCLGLVQQQQQRRRSRRQPPKAAGCCCWTRPRQGRQDGPRPDQAKAKHNKQDRGVLAGPETPSDPKSHIFVTNWVAIPPLCTFVAGPDAEFRRGSRQVGLTPPQSQFVSSF